MFDSVNRLFSLKGGDQKSINRTSSVLEDVSDYDDSLLHRNDEQVQDLDAFEIDHDNAVINDMLPDIPAIDDVKSSDDDIISAEDVFADGVLGEMIGSSDKNGLSTSEVTDDDYDDFQEI
jgi:hypothetical protein